MELPIQILYQDTFTNYRDISCRDFVRLLEIDGCYLFSMITKVKFNDSLVAIYEKAFDRQEEAVKFLRNYLHLPYMPLEEEEEEQEWGDEFYE